MISWPFGRAASEGIDWRPGAGLPGEATLITITITTIIITILTTIIITTNITIITITIISNRPSRAGPGRAARGLSASWPAREAETQIYIRSYYVLFYH